MTATTTPGGADYGDSRFPKYTTTGALIYYALLFPALLVEAIFTVGIASTPGDLLVQVGASGNLLVLDAVRLLPLAFLIGSIYAIISFRPSLLVILLIASFFIAASVASEVPLLGAQLGLERMVILTLAGSFLALTGFNYSRGLELLEDRRPSITSSGPAGYNVLGIALEVAVPLVAALALVVVVESIVGALTIQAARLPPPLSTLLSLYLQSRIGAIFTTLFVAGATIWIMRQFLEPLILHFTLNSVDARKELLADIRPSTSSVRKVIRYRPSIGLGWGVLGVVYCTGLVSILAFLTPPGAFIKDFLAALKLGSPSPTPLETLIQGTLKDEVTRINILFVQVQNDIREILTLLWG